MHRNAVFLSLLITSALATPNVDALFPRGWNRNGWDNNCRAIRQFNCLNNYGGPAFFSSYCGNLLPNKRTSTQVSTAFVAVTAFDTTVTDITARTYVTGSPVVTGVVATATSTVLVPVTSTSYSSTVTVLQNIATNVGSATLTETEFTCAPQITSTSIDESDLTFSILPIPETTSTSADESDIMFSILPIFETTSTSVDESEMTFSILPFPAITPRADKRQVIDTSTIDLGSQIGSSTASNAREFTCSSKYGYAGMTSACKCTRLPAPTVTARVTASTSVGAITTVGVLTETVTPTITSIISTTIEFNASSTSVFDGGVLTETVNVTASVSYATTVTITTTSPIPTGFRLAINSTEGRFVNAKPDFSRPDGTVIGSTFGVFDAGSIFALDSQSRLTTLGFFDGLRFPVEKNSRDPYPFLFVSENITDPANGLQCSVCSSTLNCDYPGTKGNTFAYCNGFLALGPDLGTPETDGVPTSDPCVRVELGLEGYRGYSDPSATISSFTPDPTSTATASTADYPEYSMRKVGSSMASSER